MSSDKGNFIFESPLLIIQLRIKAAQEKARLAQQKQKAEEAERRKREKEETRQHLAQLKEQEQHNIKNLPLSPPTYDELQAKIDAAAAAKEDDDAALMELDNEMDTTNNNDFSYLKPPPMEEAAANNTNDLSYMKPPPPPEDVPMQMEASDLAYMQPPPLEDEPSASAFAPSAPPAEDMHDPSTLSNSFHGGELPVPMSVLDPSTGTHAPPSYGELLKEQQQAYFQHEGYRTASFHAGQTAAATTNTHTYDSSAPAFDFDEMGNAMSPSDRLKMEEEQRQILKQIQEEAAANAKAIREAMGTSGMGQQATSTSGFSNGTTQHSLSQPHPSEQHEVEVMPPPARSRGPTQIIDVGSGQKVAVHDQAKTREAISRGTALLVECVSCQNWMQISETATLMFCPCCQSVVPIVKQNTVRTREEAILLQRDRKMAEQLQREENERTRDDVSGVATATGTIINGAEEEISFGSFKEYMSSLFGYGDTTKAENAAASSSSQILPYPGAASRPVASLSSSNQDQAAAAASAGGTLYEASIVGGNDLLLEQSNSTDEEERLLPARVAHQPAHAFSCFETGVVSNLFGKITGKSNGASDDYEQVEFDDELLAMTDRDRLGRADDGPTSTEYTRLLDDDDDNAGNLGGNSNDNNQSGRGQYEPARIV
jgi:hypothetical protein